MAKVRVEWHPEDAIRATSLKLERGMVKAAMFVEGEVVKKVNRGQPVRRTKGGHLVGLDPSKPGEPPKVVSARLKQSITHDVENDGMRITARIGSNLKYARRLELGFTGTDSRGRNYNQARRPAFRPALLENLDEVRERIKNG